MVFAISLVVMLFLAAYALSDPGLELAVVTGDVHEHAGAQAVVHGRVVDSNGDGLADAALAVSGPTGTKIAEVDEQGFFRLDLLGACAAYRVDLRGRSHGRALVTRLERRLCPGDELEVDARVIVDGQLVWIPAR
jgi:hypothetical protein